MAEGGPVESPETKPDWVKKLKMEDQFLLDMTSLVENGLEPLPVILRLVEDIRPCQCLHLVFNHEPLLVYQTLEKKGFERYSEFRRGVWDIYFRQKNCPCPGQT
jgi:hypothetical protein